MTCKTDWKISTEDLIQTAFGIYGLIVTEQELDSMTEKAKQVGEEIFRDAVIEHIQVDAVNPPVAALITPLINKRLMRHASGTVH